MLYLYPVGKRVIDLLKVINEHLASCYRLTAEELQAEISPIQRECTTLPLEVFSQRNFVADFIQSKLSFIQNNEVRFLSHPLGDLEVTYALHL